MTGICGWFGVCVSNADALIGTMRERITWGGEPATSSTTGREFGIAAVGAANTIGTFAFGPIKVAFHGHGYWRDDGARVLPVAELCRRLATAYSERGSDSLAELGGDFALAIVDLDRQRTLLAVDRSGIRNLVYCFDNGVLAFGANLDALAAHPIVKRRIDAQALYNYVYFHMVPGPGTVYEGVSRLLPGHCALVQAGNIAVKRYWAIEFVEDRSSRMTDLENEFLSALNTSVESLSAGQACGTFLSGGTDSSTITGVLSKLSANSVGSYSIGFDAAGYDEMEYARIAARHFKTEHHEYYVTPADVVAALPLVAAEYDQPFGNASAVPAYYCAKLANASGVTRMLAGDGGDELFGGNSRYARQYQLALYERVPSLLRTLLVEPILHTSIAGAIPLLRKGRSYVDQARLPMPARYETYNLLERLGPENVFNDEFLAEVDRHQPLEMLSAAYDSAQASSLINRMLALDLKFTLADNDLPKVTRMCDRAGVDVAFPLLHDGVVAFSATLPPELKLRRTTLRYFFKRALRDFLPPAIIAKQKHGFGLPAGVWLTTYEPLRSLSRDALASLEKRRIFKRRFLEGLQGVQLHEHAAYYGTMLWILVMLELWFQEHVDHS
jgi:asparagine synthase (glutamine-hydrolysing)